MTSDRRIDPPPSWVGQDRRLDWGELDRYDRSSIAVDCVLFTVDKRQLKVLVHKRAAAPSQGEWALPGGFVTYPERGEDAVRRVLKEKTGIDADALYVERLDWSDEPNRDDRGWVVTLVYLALSPVGDLRRAIANVDVRGMELAPVFVPWSGERGEWVHVHLEGETRSLAWDHNQLVGLGVKRLRGKLRYTPLALEFVDDTFTLRQLQEVYETVLGHPLNRATFQKLVIDDLRLVEPTGESEPPGVGRRRAQLYQRAS